MQLKIVQWPSPSLKEVSAPVVDTGGIDALVKDMVQTMNVAGGVGLSAIQVGVPLRVVVTKFPSISVLINPTLEVYRQSSVQEVERAVAGQSGVARVPYGELVRVREGCLSLPGVVEEVRRWNRVLLRFQGIGPEGDLFSDSILVDGLAAQCIQHELEHLDGKFFLDHVGSGRRDAIRASLRRRR